MNRRISAQVLSGELEERDGGTQTVLLQMDKCAGELNQGFVESVLWTSTLCQPELFEHFVRLKKELLIKAVEIREVMGIVALTGEIFDQGIDARRFLAQGLNI